MVSKQFLGDHTKDNTNERIGLVQSFHMRDFEAVKKTISEFKKLGITAIRTNVTWSDWHAEGSQEWFEWLLPTLGKELQLLPCIIYSSGSAIMEAGSSLPALNLQNSSLFIDGFIHRFGKYFKHIEFCNVAGEQNFESIIPDAARVARQHGKKVVLGGLNPHDTGMLHRLCNSELMPFIDVVGMDCLGEVPDKSEDRNAQLSLVQDILLEHRSPAKIWITECGFSTSQHTERGQLNAFIKIINTDCERIYWNGLKDETPVKRSFGHDPQENIQRRWGMKNHDDSPKLLYTLLASKGLQKIADYEWMTEPVIGISENNNDRYTLVTGGAGFVGVNLADKLLSQGKKVLIFDNLSRSGVENNLFWLREKHPVNLQIMIADIRDRIAVNHAVERAEQVFHFAAQVAVTSSLENPFYDFEVNAQGTLNLLEAIRNSPHQPPVLFASTNKVYGSLDDLGIVMNGTRYYPENAFFNKHGISEKRNLDFHSPYGCTKGVADQYMLDYSRTFGIKTVVFRMSCIYGPHQFGTEDQGWVAHFLIQALKNKPIMLYGDGKQVRDILFVDDLVNAYILAMENIDDLYGNAFNIGGGVKNTVSLLELCDIIGETTGKKPEVRFSDWRPSDQKYYVSDFSKFHAVTGWKPRATIREGVQRLNNWLRENAVLAPVKKESKSKVTNPV